MPTLADIQNRPVKLVGWKRTATLQVIRKLDGKKATIDLTKFDENLHTRIEPGEKVPTKTPEELKAEREAAEKHLREQQELAAAESITRDEMTTMSMSALKLLPAWKRLPANAREKAKTKEEVIDLICKG